MTGERKLFLTCRLRNSPVDAHPTRYRRSLFQAITAAWSPTLALLPLDCQRLSGSGNLFLLTWYGFLRLRNLENSHVFSYIYEKEMPSRRKSVTSSHS